LRARAARPTIVSVLVRAAIATAAAALLAAGPADAAQRYAEPGGDGLEASCPQTNPCSLDDAADGLGVQDGDEVLLAPGTYVVTEPVDVTSDVWIHPTDPAAPRPVVTSPTDESDVFDVRGAADAKLSDLAIRATGQLSIGLALGSGVGERLAVTSAGGGACALYSSSIATAVLRDSFCTDTAGGYGVAAIGDEPSESASFYLANVTAVSMGPGPRPYGVLALANHSLTTVEIEAHNVIAYSGVAEDVRAEMSGGATSSSVSLESSNYDMVSIPGGGSVTAPGAGSNQTAAPLFANLAGGDVHEALGSPTIDAGESGFLYFGDLDVDRDPRTVGSAPDIGGDEFVPDTTAPETTITKHPKKKILTRKKRKKAKFAFISDERGSTFTCKLDKKAPKPCNDGTFVKKVKLGKHRFEVTATDAVGNTDPTPEVYKWKVKRKKT
jgi:hypothetical protein